MYRLVNLEVGYICIFSVLSVSELLRQLLGLVDLVVLVLRLHFDHDLVGVIVATEVAFLTRQFRELQGRLVFLAVTNLVFCLHIYRFYFFFL